MSPPPPEEEGAAETTCDELTTTPIPRPPVQLGGEEVLQAPEQREIPLQPMVKTMVRQAVPLQPMEVHDGADIYLQPMEDPTPKQVDAQRRL